MADLCLFFDNILTPYYKKTHCGLYCREISEEHFREFCLTKKSFRCPYFVEFCKKLFADDDEILQKLSK